MVQARRPWAFRKGLPAKRSCLPSGYALNSKDRVRHRQVEVEVGACKATVPACVWTRQRSPLPNRCGPWSSSNLRRQPEMHRAVVNYFGAHPIQSIGLVFVRNHHSRRRYSLPHDPILRRLRANCEHTVVYRLFEGHGSGLLLSNLSERGIEGYSPFTVLNAIVRDHLRRS